jgi:hypothetical protein
MVVSYIFNVIEALFAGPIKLEVMRLLMKNRTRYYGRNF